jgi:predicted RNA-binding Zn-ribbon protein involved in translation (DUF1610 family)
MAFQFLCPQGHLLQADQAQMGQTINCPTCGVLFVVPTLTKAAAAPAETPLPPAAGPPAAIPPARVPRPEPEEDDPAQIEIRRGRRRRHSNLELPPTDEPAEEVEAAEPAALPESAVSQRAAFDPEGSGPKLVHVACPAGHELITPLDSMGQEVLCPYCGAQFVMRYKATREFKDERQRKEDAQQQKLGENWLMWAVIVGVGVLVMLVGMMILSSR